MPTQRSLSSREWMLEAGQLFKDFRYRLEGALDGVLFHLLGASGPKETKPAFKAIQSILVLRPDEIGDLALSSLFLRELRRCFPKARITLVVKPGLLNWVRNCPDVDEVLAFDFSRPRGVPRVLSHFWRSWRFGSTYRSARVDDLAICPRWDTDWYYAGLLAFFCGARQRVAFSEAIRAEKRRYNPGFDRLYTWVSPLGQGLHEAVRPFELLRAIGARPKPGKLSPWLSIEDQLWAKDYLKRFKVGLRDRLLVIGPGAGSTKRRWPVERYVEVAGTLAERDERIRFLVLGSAEDRTSGARFEQSLGKKVINATGSLSLGQSAAVLEHCELFLGNDSGPMHLAAAAGCKVIEVSCHPKSGDPESSNSPRRFGPWGVLHKVLQPSHGLQGCTDACHAFYPHCILEVSSADVIASASVLLGKSLASARARRTGRQRDLEPWQNELHD